ncbi:MAG: SMC-Scp complex subunit ScpB [Treponema sp.]|nr:SMC-Scp complex subunit ScpB [Treponema sp.]
MDKEAALIEAILYLESEALDESALARISGLPREKIEPALARLEEDLARAASGIEISRVGGGISLSPKRDYWEILRERYGKRSESRLSRAAMETLSIIAYSQPITRNEIEEIRGVQADTMIRLLVEKQFVKEMGKKDVPGKPIQYGTTADFLRFFRLNSIADLPKLDEREADRFDLQGEE